jgi:phage repressor protein C with HTH and peptisase S24 domain
MDTEHRQFEAILAKIYGGVPARLARDFGVSPQAVSKWQAGGGFGPKARALLLEKFATLSEPIELSDAVDIPRLTVTASAGPGACVDEVVVEMIRVTRAWLAANVAAPHNSLAIITAKGDSMEPTFLDGDLLLVDRSATMDRDGIYVFSAGQYVFVKRLQRLPDGSLRVISDNRARYEPYTLGADADFQLHGRVIRLWKSEKI